VPKGHPPVFDYDTKSSQRWVYRRTLPRRLNELNKKFLAKGLPTLRHGIGIHAREARAANIGSPNRLSYLLVGDTVNLASRLQSLTKELGTEMIISAATHARLSETELNTIRFREPTLTKVKGKTLPVEIFALP